MPITNPYYQRVFNSIGGTLARARQMVNEFQLIQTAFDLLGSLKGPTKYQLSCSDLVSDLLINETAGYFRIQRAFTLSGVRASLIRASTSGLVQLSVKVNGTELCSVPLTIDVGEKTSVTAATPVQLAFTAIPDDAEVVVGIVSAGAGAQGLIVSLIGTISAADGYSTS